MAIEHNLFVRNSAQGADHASDSGSGGAISMRPAYGIVQFNTFAGNMGASNASGGAILIQYALSNPLTITNNIIVDSESEAIRCVSRDFSAVDTGVKIESNLFWNNDPGNLEDSDSCIPKEWREFNLFEDPLFCGAEADNFTVSKDSPALTNGTPIGAFWDPGCGAGVPVEETSWGKIKALYHTPH